jgi:hypothetical protein
MTAICTSQPAPELRRELSPATFVCGVFVFGPSSRVRKDLGQNVPKGCNINAMIPVRIGAIGERSNTNNNKNAPHFSLPRAMPELQPTVLAV